MHTYKSDFLRILDERGFLNQCTDFEALDNLATTGKITAYCGYDPTASSLHVGSLISIMMLYWAQATGHNAISLMGGGTGRVGDPSFKDKARSLVGQDIIAERIASIKTIFSAVIDYDSPKNPARMVNNAEWLEGLGYLDFLTDYGAHFSVNRMLSFDSVKLRLEREQNLSFLEFNYMILQAYDFVELYRRYGCNLQIGGSDQWGNIINGVELGRRKENAQLFGLTTNLLTTASGQKMGKSEGNAVWLNPDMCSDFDFYQFWRNTEDLDVIKFMKLFTVLPMAEIARYAQLQGADINEAKKALAFEVTKLLRGEAAAQGAAETAKTTFEQGGAGDNLPTISLKADMSVVDALVELGFAESKGAAKRLIKEGGARLNDNVVQDEQALVELHNDVAKISAGKKRHGLVKG